jgi:hypothetical protein
MLPHVEEWARKDQKCDSAVVHGRKGWERTFITRTQGWKASHVVFTKELKDE